MKDSHIDRRLFLGAAAVSTVAASAQDAPPAAAEDKEYHPVPPNYQIVSSYKREGQLGMPGRYPGSVVEVRSGDCISEKTDRVNREAVRKMVARGMMELTHAPDAVSAWKALFDPGDRVAIKVNASGAPQCISSPELVQEVISGLFSAGVKAGDIWLYERYANQMDLVSYEVFVPDGVNVWSGARGRNDLEGTDRDVYVDVSFFGEDDRRSYLSSVVSKHVNKIINIPNVKDHASAGATGCLKNIAYGSFNNVARSHQGFITNVRTYIGTLCSVEPLRSRTVLHVLDGLRGVWHGGPQAFTPRFVWYPKYLQFGTDPVAMDRLLIDTIEQKRKEMGAVSIFNRNKEFLGHTRADPRVMVRYREPEHVQYAASLGLGVAELERIKFKRLHA